jgi:hypothetical protein
LRQSSHFSIKQPVKQPRAANFRFKIWLELIQSFQSSLLSVAPSTSLNGNDAI